MAILNNGFCLQWITGKGTVKQHSLHNYPISFNTVYGAVISHWSDTGGDIEYISVSGLSVNQIKILSAHTSRYAIIIGS